MDEDTNLDLRASGSDSTPQPSIAFNFDDEFNTDEGFFACLNVQ